MVFRLHCIATTKLDEWSNVWHVYGLTSVLNTPITSIYPQVNSRVRQLFHWEVHPRICDVGLQSSIPLVIMWTHLSSIPKQCVDTHWSPNHFVPCFASTTLTITTPLIASREKDGNTPSSKSQTTLTDSHSVLTDVGQAAISSPRVSLPSTLSLSSGRQTAISHSSTSLTSRTLSLTSGRKTAISHSPSSLSSSTLSLPGGGQKAIAQSSTSLISTISRTLSLPSGRKTAISHSSSGLSSSTLWLPGGGQKAIAHSSISLISPTPSTLSLPDSGHETISHSSTNLISTIPSTLSLPSGRKTAISHSSSSLTSSTLSLPGGGHETISHSSTSLISAIPSTLSLPSGRQTAISHSYTSLIFSTLSLPSGGHKAIAHSSTSLISPTPSTLSLSRSGHKAISRSSTSLTSITPSTLSLSSGGYEAITYSSTSPILSTLSLPSGGHNAISHSSTSLTSTTLSLPNDGHEAIPLSSTCEWQTSNFRLPERWCQNGKMHLKGATSKPSNCDVSTATVFHSLADSTPQKTARCFSSSSFPQLKPLVSFLLPEKKQSSKMTAKLACTPVSCVHQPVSALPKGPSYVSTAVIFGFWLALMASSSMCLQPLNRKLPCPCLRNRYP